jgi:hypothetical protein
LEHKFLFSAVRGRYFARLKAIIDSFLIQFEKIPIYRNMTWQVTGKVSYESKSVRPVKDFQI